jgi:hypothetical protein
LTVLWASLIFISPRQKLKVRHFSLPGSFVARFS